MIHREPFDDPILGRVTWDNEGGEWHFAVSLGPGHLVTGSIIPEDHREPLHTQGLGEIRSRVAWVRDHEPEIRTRIAEAMFDDWFETWRDEESDEVSSREEFRDAISLSGIIVLEDRNPELCYNDGGLFGGHSIVLTVGDDGHFVYEPEIWG